MSATHVQISLEALLARAVNPTNGIIDSAAVEAFCALVNKEKDGPQIGVKVLAARLPFGGEQEILGILSMVDTCMPNCGTYFQNEVGKFRFLNEMIKLVSPKYLGGKTPLSVKLRVLELLYLWTVDYPKEVKIKEAFDMLRKQGVVKALPNPNIPPEALTDRKRNANSVFQDEEKSNILRKLLQSKDPEDIQAANWLIKSMVKEDEKLCDLKSKAISDLESVQNNIKLLNEMINSHRKGVTTQNELDIMKELYDNCVVLRPHLTAIACQTKQCPEDLLENVLRTTDEVTETLSRYHRIVLLDQSPSSSQSNYDSLLELDHDISCRKNKSDGLATTLVNACQSSLEQESSVDVLCDLLLSSGDVPENTDILKPMSLSPDNSNGNAQDVKPKNGLEELDFLGEHLLKENLPTSSQRNEKIPMNILCQINKIKQNQLAASQKDKSLKLDLNYLVEKSNGIKNELQSTDDELSTTADSSDDCLVDITEDEKYCEQSNSSKESVVAKESSNLVKGSKSQSKLNNCDTLKLNDIFVKLEDIKPSSKKSLVALDEKNGISILLHLARDRPKPGVSVYVVTAINKNEMALSSYDFKAVVPKGCKLKLQPSSSTELPPFNPFLPPAAITQIMLIANPDSVKVTLRFVLSYVMDDENYTEMGEVNDLPLCDGD